MPRPRFSKLPADKRERILEASAKAFAAHGYDRASLNQILSDASISKGAAYYYFDDKADLYATTVLHYVQELMTDVQFDAQQLTVVSFWDQITNVYRRQFTQFYERPWVLGVVKAAGSPSATLLTEGPLAQLWQQMQPLLAQLIEHGQQVGAIRTDLPTDLLLALMLAVDEAHDRWLYEHWTVLSPADIEQAAARISDTLRRLLAPQY